MSIIKKSLAVAFVAIVAFTSSPVVAQDDYYAKMSLGNIFKTLIRYEAIDIKNDDFIDSYARVTECDRFYELYEQQFKWDKERERLRKEIKRKVHAFPVAYKYETKMQLDRYDFDKKIFPFRVQNENARLVNTFAVESKKVDSCIRSDQSYVPLNYNFVLKDYYKLDGLHLSEKEGEELFKRMLEAKNDDYIIYSRLNFRVRYVASFIDLDEYRKAQDTAKADVRDAKLLSIVQPRTGASGIINVDLDSVEFFEDEDRTKLIYTYRP